MTIGGAAAMIGPSLLRRSASGRENAVFKTIAATVALATCFAAAPALAQDQGGPPQMFWFNLKLDHYVLHPVAQGYAAIAPTPVRESVGRFFNNVNFIPRVANNLFQLRFPEAGTEVARFGINSTLGVGGLFDVADNWFGLKEHPNDFGLTLGHYGVGTGPYIVWPFLGPSDVRDTIGYAADNAMWPLPYFVPWYVWLPADSGKAVVEAVNYRSLHLNLFEDVDRYAVDLYGAVQDGYLQRRAAAVKDSREQK
jgi:phospholipid-binding lipoprotein MlaA